MATICKILLRVEKIETLAGLIQVADLARRLSPTRDLDTVILETPVSLKLVEDTLSDGSQVYNIEIEEALS
jgi:hypothetical protein